MFRGEDFYAFECNLYTVMAIQNGVIPLKNGPNGKQPETDQSRVAMGEGTSGSGLRRDRLVISDEGFNGGARSRWTDSSQLRSICHTQRP